MKTEFTLLREKARQKRDRTIAVARHNYEQTLVAIASLEQELLGSVPKRHKRLSTAIESVIPTDRTFTVVDVFTALEAMDPSRAWRTRSIDNHLSRLRRKGIIRRIKRSTNNDHAIYAMKGVEVPTRPFQDMRLVDVVAATLGDESMRLADIAVRMLEQGYETTMNRKQLQDAIGVVMKNNPKRFKRDGQKWSVTK